MGTNIDYLFILTVVDWYFLSYLGQYDIGVFEFLSIPYMVFNFTVQ